MNTTSPLVVIVLCDIQIWSHFWEIWTSIMMQKAWKCSPSTLLIILLIIWKIYVNLIIWNPNKNIIWYIFKLWHFDSVRLMASRLAFTFGWASIMTSYQWISSFVNISPCDMCGIITFKVQFAERHIEVVMWYTKENHWSDNDNYDLEHRHRPWIALVADTLGHDVIGHRWFELEFQLFWNRYMIIRLITWLWLGGVEW